MQGRLVSSIRFRLTNLINRGAALSSVLLVFGLGLPLVEAQYVQQGPKLVGAGITNSTGQVGVARVAVSADGNTAVIGTPYDHTYGGAVTVFVRVNGAWTQQGPKLVGSDASGPSVQGFAVALSADGNTVLSGGPNDANGTGATWVFTRSNGTWAQQGPKLVGSDTPAGSGQGNAVALSADGNTALIGAPSDSAAKGSFTVFVRVNGVWAQQGPKLQGTPTPVPVTLEGASVALSADGNTALIGGPHDNAVSGNEQMHYTGASWVFTRSNGVWTQQAKLVASDGVYASQGSSVALSADGNTAAIGGYSDGNVGVSSNNTGAVFVFTRSNGIWSEQGPKLAGSLATNNAAQGTSVALSSDGNTLLEGGQGDLYEGAAWVFTRTNTTWSQAGSKLVGSGAAGHALQGGSVALSANANVAIIAGGGDSGNVGAAWVFQGSPPGIASQAYLTSQTLGTLRNNFAGFVGLAFTVGSNPVQIKSLGRIDVAGNSQSHQLKLVLASTGADVPGASTSVNMSGGTPGQYAYAPLPNPILLQANTEYYLLSQEFTNGDQWYDFGPVTTTIIAAMNGPAYFDGAHYVVVTTLPNYAYVPVNFLYAPASSGASLTVAITSPADGSSFSGSSIPVTTSTTGNVASVQLQLNGQNVGSPSTTPPYSLTLDASLLNTGSYVLNAGATGVGGDTATSQGVTISVNNASGPTPFITAQSPGGIRKNYTGFAGMAFTVGAAPLTVTSLGHYGSFSGGTHILKLVRASTGADVPGGSVAVSLGTAAPPAYAYGQLSSPVTLQANTEYLLLSQESAGGDVWFDYGPVTPTGVATVNGPAYTDGTIYNIVTTLPGQAYIPVNFTYLPTGSNLSVSITSPQNGATLSGSVPVSMSTTGPVTSVQLQINGQNIGNASTAPPYTINLDTTTLSNGSYTLTAVASDGQNHSAQSPGVAITVNNSSSGTSTPFITGQTPGTARNNFPGFVGFAFTVGSTPLQLTSLGRMFLPGNTATHFLKLVNGTTNTDVPGGSVMVPLAGGTAGQYQYAALAAPVTLSANTTYYLLSLETVSGDQWYDYGPTVTTNVAANIGPAYRDTGASTNPYIVVSTLPNYAYGPVNFTYATSASTGSPLITSQVPGGARNSFTGFVGFAFTVGSTPINVSSVGRIFLAGNAGTHVVRLVQAANGVEVPGGAATVSMTGGTAGLYKYAALAGPITLAANTTCYLVSQETAGGDQWFDFGPVTATNFSTVAGPVYLDTSGAGYSYNVVTTLPNYAYGPVNLIYQ